MLSHLWLSLLTSAEPSQMGRCGGSEAAEPRQLDTGDHHMAPPCVCASTLAESARGPQHEDTLSNLCSGGSKASEPLSAEAPNLSLELGATA